MSTLTWNVKGWYRINSQGLRTIYLTIEDEAFTGAAGDVVPFAEYKPRIRNPELFGIRRRPTVWPWSGEGAQAATGFGQLELHNYDGAYNFMLDADMRDCVVVLRVPQRMMFGGAADTAPIVCTCILDDAYSDDEDYVIVTLKDVTARLDQPLPMRFVPPYADSASANRMVPLTLGSCRNIAPLLFDSTGDGTGQPIYLLHDQAITNITAVRDMGAVLDPNATPPQYQSAFNASAVQCQTQPIGKLLVDCSSEGQQAIIPGASDVLLGVGEIKSTTNPGSPGVTTWTAPFTTNPPSGWTYTNSGGTSGTFGRFTAANGISQDWGVTMSCKKAYTATGNGFYMTLNTAQLQPGRTYRISIVVDRAYMPNGDPTGSGLYLTTSPTTRNGGISGSSYGPYINAPSVNGTPYTFLYKVPDTAAVQTISVVMVGNPGYASDAQIVWHGLKAELLGQYIDLPQVGIGLADYMAEIAQRWNDPTTLSYNVTDLTNLDDITGYEFGVHYDEQPTVLDAIAKPLDQYCATYFTDALGRIRFRRLIDPKLGTPVATFNASNMQRPIKLYNDKAQYLTTLMGVRTNWEESGPSDFVTDYTSVPANVRARFSRTSQYQVYSTVSPAAQYANAIGAPQITALFDTVEEGQLEIDRVVSIYAPQIYSDGTIFNGKRRFIEFTVFFDDWTNIAGAGSPAPQDLLFGDVVTVDYPTHGLNNVPCMIAGTELFPFAQKLTIWGFI